MENIGRKIKTMRKRLNLSQEDLAKRVNSSWHRQTLGDIENNKRELKAWELAKIATALGVELSDFLHPKAIKKSAICWRNKPENFQELEVKFIKKCQYYQTLEDLLHINRESNKFPSYKLNLEEFSLSEAYKLGEEIRRKLRLGEYPSYCLFRELEERYNVKFIFESLGSQKCAAFCCSDEYGIGILLNGNEAPWYRHFSLAHELFHIVTWSKELSSQIDNNLRLREKNEEFADAFAASLLIPRETLAEMVSKFTRKNGFCSAVLVAIARQFGVSIEALARRMGSLKIIDEKVLKKILNNSQVLSLDRTQMVNNHLPYTSRFVELAFIAYEKGEISRSKLAQILSVPLSGLKKRLKEHGYGELNNDKIPINNT